MAILLNPWSYHDEWAEAFSSELPDLPIQIWPDVTDPEAILYAIVGSHPAEDFARYPNLLAILPAAAGVDQLGSLDDLPDVPIVRLVEPSMSNEMATVAVHWVVHFQKRYDVFAEQQADSEWRELAYPAAHKYTVGILGYGTIGGRVAEVLVDVGYPVNGWSRTPREMHSGTHYAGLDQLDEFLSACSAIINLLPATPDTHNLMNADRFAYVGPGALYFTMGRGTTTDTAALVDALDSGRLHAAVLDVTDPEPLPTDSPLWSHPKITITPHVAGYTAIGPAATVIAANIRRIEAGETPFPLVDRFLGY
jgi:glyoxylate/hydroxypyruvate reductase A